MVSFDFHELFGASCDPPILVSGRALIAPYTILIVTRSVTYLVFSVSSIARTRGLSVNSKLFMPVDETRRTTVVDAIFFRTHGTRNLCCRGDPWCRVDCVPWDGVERLFSLHPTAFFRSHARARRLGDNGTITGTMCVAEGEWFRHHGSFAKALGETNRRLLTNLAVDHGSREDTRVVILKGAWR